MENEKRLIDANALIEILEEIAETDESMYFHLDEITQEIFDTPTVEAVEVVRCKDCRFYRKPFCILNDNKNGWLNHELPEHFCSHGEREKDG